MSVSSNRYAHTVDGLRFFAALLLAIGHLSPGMLLPAGAKSFLLSGIVSTIFFALSGLILCQTSSFRHRSWRDLNLQRFARLYPLHLAACLPYAVFFLFGKDSVPFLDVVREYLWWLTDLQVFRIPDPETLSHTMNGPAWSVTPLLYGGFLLPVLRTAGMPHWPKTHIAAALAATLILRISRTASLPFSTDGVQLNQWHMEPLPHVLEILAGGMTALLLARGLPPRLEAFLASGRALALASTLVFLPLALSIHGFGRPGAFYFVHGPVFPFVLFLVTAAYSNRAAAPWMKSAGALSMPLFLLHMPVHEILQRLSLRIAGSDLTQSLPGLCVVLGITLLISRLALGPAEWARRAILSASPVPSPTTPALQYIP